MPYTNTIVTTSTGGTWNSGTGLSYSTITLIDGIPHSAQLEVERVFTEPRSTGDYATIEDFLNNSATTQKDKQQVFIIPASRITFNETSKTITAIDLPSTGNTYDFNPDGAGLANVPVPAIVSGTSVLKVRRKTVSNETLVTWSAGSKLTSAQLNLEVKQLIYLIQELIDKTTTEVNVSNTTIGTVTNYSITPIKLSAGGPTWDSSSRLGIGMTPTTRTLSVYQASAPTIQIVNSTTGSLAGDGGIVWMSGNDMLISNQEAANLKLETGGSTRLTISSSGDVGIGTTSPSQKLHVYGGTIRADNTTGSSGDISLIATGGPSGSGSNLQVLHETGNSLVLLNSGSSGGNFSFRGSGGTSMRIDTSGNVGIGTTSPSQKLHVYGAAGTICLLESSNASPVSQVMGYIGAGNDSAYTGTISNHPYSLITNNTTRLAITASGNVGIGTAGPSFTLDVVGIGRFANANNDTKLLIEGYGDTKAYGIQFTPANDTSTFPCRFHNAAGTLVGSIQTTASTATFNGTATTATNLTTNGIGQTVSFSTTWAGTGSPSGFTKTASSATLSLPTGTWQGFSMAQTATAGSAVTIVSHNSATASITLAATASLVNCWVVLTRTA